MQLSKIDQKGIAVLIVVLVAVMASAVIGAGYLVFKNNTSSGNQTQDNKEANDSTSDDTEYFTIKEWDVRAPYGSITDRYTYKLSQNDQVATIISETFAEKSPQPGRGCAAFGAGIIIRVPENSSTAIPTVISEPGLTGKEFAKKYPGKATLVEGYYYAYEETNKLCGSGATPEEQAEALSDARSLNKRLEAIPSK